VLTFFQRCSFIVTIALIVTTDTAFAQFIWHRQTTIEHSQWGNIYTSLDCSGDNCTAAGLAETDDSPYVSLLFEHSSDGGKTWTQTIPDGFPEFTDGWHWVPKIQQVDSLTAIALIDSLAILQNGSADIGSLARTRDGGKSWARMLVPTQWSITDFHFSDANTGIFITAGGGLLNDSIFTTTDGGSNWTRSYVPLTFYAVSCHSFGNGRFRVWTSDYGPFHSTTNNWTSWDSSNWANPDHDPNELLNYCSYSGFDTAYCFGVLLHQGASLRRTTDAGKTWTDIPAAKALTIIRYMTPPDRDTIYAAGGFHTPQLLKSTDRGNTWAVEDITCDTDLASLEIRSLAMTASGAPLMILDNGGRIYTYAHIFRGSWDAAGVAVGIPSTRFNIYPNPATSYINVKTDATTDRAYLFDILGHEVRKTAIRDGKARLDVSELPQGIYSLRLERQGITVAISHVALLK
jgi:photosystem II stability/assembly factor-like uncharacterized protein